MKKQTEHTVSFAHLHIVCICSKEEKHHEPACPATMEEGSIFLFILTHRTVSHVAAVRGMCQERLNHK